MLNRLFYILACLTLLSLAACQGYDLTVNDKIVYSPPPLFKAFTVPDEALHQCLEQAIIDGAVTAPEQLSALNCSNAGIENLEGLSSFPGIKTLRFSSNKIRNLVEINKMLALEELYLDDNRVVDPVPLYPLQKLRHVDLSGNASLQCPRKGGLDQVETVILPLHCT
jgi:Leucine-rich repeat (LRR) protein